MLVRCFILCSKFAKNRCRTRWGSLQRSSRPLSWITGKGRSKGRKSRRGGKGKGKRRRGGEGSGRERRGKGGVYIFIITPKQQTVDKIIQYNTTQHNHHKSRKELIYTVIHNSIPRMKILATAVK